MENICGKFFIMLQLGECFIRKNGGLERFTFIFSLIQKRKRFFDRLSTSKIKTSIKARKDSSTGSE